MNFKNIIQYTFHAIKVGFVEYPFICHRMFSNDGVKLNFTKQTQDTVRLKTRII